jgi:hypothetical protein
LARQSNENKFFSFKRKEEKRENYTKKYEKKIVTKIDGLISRMQKKEREKGNIICFLFADLSSPSLEFNVHQVDKSRVQIEK